MPVSKNTLAHLAEANGGPLALLARDLQVATTAVRRVALEALLLLIRVAAHHLRLLPAVLSKRSSPFGNPFDV